MTPLEDTTCFHSQLNHARFLGQAEKLIHSTCAGYTGLGAEVVRLVDWLGGQIKMRVSQASRRERFPRHIIVTKTQGVEGPEIVLRFRGRECGG